MAPGKPVGVVKIRVPRHNAQHIGLKLSGEVRAQAEAEGIRTDIYQPNSESANALALAVVCMKLTQGNAAAENALRKVLRTGILSS